MDVIFKMWQSYDARSQERIGIGAVCSTAFWMPNSKVGDVADKLVKNYGVTKRTAMKMIGEAITVGLLEETKDGLVTLKK